MTDILLDLDLDFFFNDPKDWTLSSEKALWDGAEEALSFFASITCTNRILVIDHHEILRHWDLLAFKSAYCVHVDAHHDAFAKDGQIWRRPLGSRGAMVGVGDFMFQAIRENIIGKMIWLTPPSSIVSDSEKSLKKLLGSTLGRKVDVISWPSLPEIKDTVDLFSVSISPEWLNPNSEEWLSIALAKLGFSGHLIEQALIKTRERWQLCQAHAENMSIHRYHYPENYK